MDFGSIVESLAGGSFHMGTWPVSSACAHNCFDKNHYHRHCGCALHSIDTGFKGSPACSPSNTVKVSGPGSRSGRMYRSISAQNLGEKKFQSGNFSDGSGGNSYRKDDSVTSAALSPSVSFSSSVSSLSHMGKGSDDQPSGETLTFLEELTTFINLMKDEDASTTTELDDDEIGSNVSWTADEDDELHGLPNFLHQSQPIIFSNRSASPKPFCAPVINRPIPL